MTIYTSEPDSSTIMCNLSIHDLGGKFCKLSPCSENNTIKSLQYLPNLPSVTLPPPKIFLSTCSHKAQKKHLI